MSKYVDKSKCHVRYYEKSKHPCAVIGEDSYNYDFKGLSHENYKNRKVLLNKNPNPKDKSKSFIDKKYKTKNKKNFSKNKKNGWKFDKSDYNKL